MATHDSLDPATAFAVVAMFTVMRIPFVLVPMALSMWAQVAVASTRFNAFFARERSRKEDRMMSLTDGTDAPKSPKKAPLAIVDLSAVADEWEQKKTSKSKSALDDKEVKGDDEDIPITGVYARVLFMTTGSFA